LEGKMSISFQVLGAPGHDNAVLVRVDSGQALHRLLFDCGDGCVHDLSLAEVQAVDQLLFSHLHMDHVGGFDAFFRANYNRISKPNTIWGPPQTGQIMHHRFRGFLWNLVEGQPGRWEVYDIQSDQLIGVRCELHEAFALAHPLGARPHSGTIVDTMDFTITALQMEHLTPSLAYIVREKPRVNIDPAWLAGLGLRPGAWLQRVKERRADESATLVVDGTAYDLAALRATLLVETPGESLAYLTDFILDDAAYERLVPALRGCTTAICESQYRQADLALALRNYHMTAAQAAELARRAGIARLILFHLSDRYRPAEWLELLAEARAIFPETYLPSHWNLEPGP
jgi:ribonuclease Z